MSHKITGKEPLQKPCNCNTQDVLPSKLDIAIAEYKEMARKAEEARDEFLQKARALEDIAKETNATANKNAILAKFDDITIDTSTLAKDATVAKEAQATLNKEAIITAVNNAQPDLSSVAKDATVAKEATLGSSLDTSVSTTIFGWLKSIRDFLVGIVTTNPYAKEETLGDVAEVLEYIEEGGLPSINDIAHRSDVKDGNDTAIGMLKDQTNGLAAIKTQAANAASDAAAIEVLVGTPATGQPSTLFAAIAAGGGGGGGDAQESTSQAILAAVKNNDTTTLAELLNSTHGLAAIQSLLNGIVTTYPYAKEANATQNKTDVISAVNGAMSVNFLANGIQAMADAELVVVPDGGQAESVTMDANKLYVFQDRTSDLTISFGTPTANIVNEYHMLLTVGATIPTITMPNNVVWAYNDNPLSGLASYRTYEIGILYNSNSVYFAIYSRY